MKSKSLFFLAAVIVSSCTPTEKPDTPSMSGDGQGIVPRAQLLGKRICKFQPTAQTILDILDLGIPGLSKANKIAEAICKKLEEGTKGGAIPKLHGVPIRGSYVES